MRLVWADECDGTAGTPPDPHLRGIRETDEWQPAGEMQTYTRDPANAHHDGRGHLVIRAVRGSVGTRSYTSARLSARHSRRPRSFRYGRFEARIAIPTGMGLWPAWWLLGPDAEYGWPDCGEIDIMEAPSSPDTRGQIHQGTHSPSATGAGSVSAGVAPSIGRWNGFHTYTVVWTPGRIAFVVDAFATGVVTRAEVESRGGEWVFDDRPQASVVNLAVGGWAGEPDGTWSTAAMLVDRVRVYA